MSDRHSEVQENRNPAEIFLQWESNHQKLSYFDKEAGEKGEKKLVNIPFEFLWLKQMSCVKGYDDDAKMGIFSNEVEHVGKDELHVRYHKNGGDIAKGLWKDISDSVENVGGNFHISIYALSKNGSLINISLKGSAVGEWFRFTQKTRKRLPDEWVKIGGFKEGKKGSVTYYYPTFEYNGSVDHTTGLIADEKYSELKAYLTEYLGKEIHEEYSEEKPMSENTPDEMDIVVNGEKETNFQQMDKVYNLDGDEVDQLPF